MKNYNLLLKTTITLLFLLLTTIVFAQPANDDCNVSTNVNIAITTSGTTTVNTDTTNALSTENLSDCETFNFYTYVDQWYTFTMPVDGNVRITGSDTGDYFALYDTCGDSEIACFVGNDYFYDLTANQTYILKFSNRSTTAGPDTFNIQAFETVPNNECGNISETIDISNISTTTTVNTNTSGASPTENLSACENLNFYTYIDQWYTFTMPVNGNVRITNSDTGDYFALYDACGTPETACFNGNDYFYNLNTTQTYILKFSNRESGSGIDSFNIQAFETVPNNECGNVSEIIDISDVSVATTVTTNTIGASPTGTLSTCETFPNLYSYIDQWYTFTMPVDGNVRITASDSGDYFALYDACGDPETACFNGNDYFYNLNATQTYILKFSNRESGSGIDSFNMQAFETVPNNECGNVSEIIDISDISAATTVTTNTIGASPTSTLSACETFPSLYTYIDQWYTFTMPVDGNVRITTADNGDYFALYNACGDSEIACFNGNDYFYNLNATQTYILKFSNRESGSGVDMFNIQAFETAVNDLCVNAINLTVGLYDEYKETKTLFGATQTSPNPPSPSCYSLAGGEDILDVWFKVQVPTSGNITIETSAVNGSTLNDTVMQLFDSCGSTLEISCDDNSGEGNFSKINLTGLIPAEEIFIRLFENGNNIQDYYNIFAYDNNCSETAIWDGTSWSNTITTNTIGIFNADYTTDATGLNMCMCRINDDAIVTINPTEFIQISNDLINDGHFIIEPQGSFTQTDNNATIIGSGTYQTQIKTSLMDDPRYTYFSSPSETGRTSAFSAWAQMNRIFSFNGGATQNWAAAGLNELMPAGKGYIVRPSGTTPYTSPQDFSTNFNGKFNTTLSPITLSFNDADLLLDLNNDLVGNPYPSAISSVALLGDADNSSVNALYFWAHSNSGANWSNEQYIEWNNSSNPGDSGEFIASGQGFFVQANAVGTLTFKNSMRVSGNNNNFFRSSNNELDKIWLNLETEANIGSQVLIAFNPTCTDSFDAQYDAVRYESGGPITFYSKGVGISTDMLGIQTRGELTTIDTVIPLGINLTDADLTSFTISIDHLENLDNSDIYLKDNLLNNMHNLKMSAYTFLINQTGDVNTRFELIFSRNALATDENNLQNENLLVTNADETHINVDVKSDHVIKTFKAYDILGKLIIDTKPNKNNFTLHIPNIKQGTILFVKAKLENGQILKTKLIKI
ncbi:MAG: hypothetical protein V3U80_07345 [Flavobacteriaceae bacterium]